MVGDSLPPLPPLPPRPRDASKSTMGMVTIVGASPGLSGAALLASHAALRGGSGRVVVAVPSPLASIAEERKPLEAMSWSPRNDDQFWTESGIRSLMEELATDSWVIGCGLGRDRRSTEALALWLRQRKSPAVIDADGLWHLASQPALLESLGADLILTPHQGELDRLAQALDLDGTGREDVGLALQKRSGAVVVAKGPGTLVIDGNGVFANETGNPGMATAGSGDVLAGLMGALLARGDSPSVAARRGAWLHGRAGDLAASRRGEEALIAGDIIEMLGDAFGEQEDQR